MALAKESREERGAKAPLLNVCFDTTAIRYEQTWTWRVCLPIKGGPDQHVETIIYHYYLHNRHTDSLSRNDWIETLQIDNKRHFTVDQLCAWNVSRQSIYAQIHVIHREMESLS